MALYALSFLHFKFLLRKPRDLLATFVILMIWGFHESSLDISTARYLRHDTLQAFDHKGYKTLEEVILNWLHGLLDIWIGLISIFHSCFQRLGRATGCDCGTPWTFLLHFFEEY